MINPNMGRPRKPAQLQTGNSTSKEEKERLQRAEEQLQGGRELVHEIPEHLDDVAKAYYKFIVEELEISGLITNLDVPLVEQVADSLSKIKQCDEILNREGLIIEIPNSSGVDVPREHPAVSVKMKYLDKFRALSTQIGMSPSSRSQLAALNLEKIEEESDILLQILTKSS